MNNAAKVGVCAAIAAATLVVATLLAGPPGFLMFVIFYFNLLLLGAIKMLASRHQTRFRGRLPPRPGQGRQALKARPVH